MHIGLLIYGRLDTLSGGYLYDRELVSHLRAQGDRVTVVSLPWQNYGRHLLHNLSPRLLRRLQTAAFDLLLQDELNHPSLFWLNRRLQKRRPYPILSIVHHLRSSERWSGWQRWLYRWVERRYLQSVDGFIFNSQTTRHAVTALSGAEKPHVVAYPAGGRLQPAITDEAIVARARRGGPLRLLFVGNLIPRKGLDRLLTAVSTLPHSFWRLNVVGETAVNHDYAQKIRQQINANELQTQVRLHGKLPDTALAQMMAQSDLLVVPSDYEGFGIVYLEGMGVGLPAIGGVAGAAREIITPGRNGFLVGGDETAVLAQHIRRLYQDREELCRLSLAARRRYLAHPTWQESMARIHDFLTSFWTQST